MPASWKSIYESGLEGLTRRGLFRRGGLLAAMGLLGGGREAAKSATRGELKIGADIYESIGVRPIVNCKGTFTIITGSQTLPEVKQAMLEASKHYVHMDELMEGVSRRLAELTQAPWAIVTAGCAAALTHTTAACIAGADPEKMRRLPYLDGMKDEVIAPRYSRNVYDQAVRMLGVKMVEVNSAEELERAFGPRTAMVMILATGGADSGPLGTEAICQVAKRHKVPVLVDAAAEHLTIPNLHLGRGADMVAYSGGKCIRGPQSAGLLLGRKDILQAAWLNSAPHHAFGRSLKVDKEDIMGMLAAVEMWVKRDHDAEWKTWESWLEHVTKAVTKVPGVTTEVLQPRGLSNRSPQLRIHWDGAKLGITGTEVEKLLYEGYEGGPRVIFGSATGDRRGDMASSVTIMPYMMMPGDHEAVAGLLHKVLASPPRIAPLQPAATAASVAGQWDAEITFVYGSAEHRLVFEQNDRALTGSHFGERVTGDLRGAVDGDEVRFRSSQSYEGSGMSYEFTGRVEGDIMRGEVDLNEYGKATFVARRHAYRTSRRG